MAMYTRVVQARRGGRLMRINQRLSRCWHVVGVYCIMKPLLQKRNRVGGKYLPALRKKHSCKAATPVVEAPPVPFSVPVPSVEAFSSNLWQLYCLDSLTSDEVDQLNVHLHQSCCSFVNAQAQFPNTWHSNWNMSSLSIGSAASNSPGREKSSSYPAIY